MAPFTAGAIARAILGPLSSTTVILIIEFGRAAVITTYGTLNFSYIVQILTIFNQSWINQFSDRAVILSSVALSLLHYVAYIPELVKVSFVFLNQMLFFPCTNH